MGQMLFGITDIAVGGRYSNEVVSALGIGNSLSSPFLVFGLGIAFQVGPMTAQRIKKNSLTKDFFYSSFFTNSLLGLILSSLFFVFSYFILPQLNLFPNINHLVKSYTVIIAPSLLFSILFQNHKEYLQAFEDTFFSNSCILFFNLVNLFLNIALMFGKWGFPELGIIGTGISTLICRASMFVVIHFYLCKKFEMNFFHFSASYMREIVKEGLPVSFGIASEVFMFSMTTVMAGTMDVVVSAAHNICLNLGATTFMVPLALSSAVGVKVGHSYGLGNLPLLKQYSLGTIILVFSFMVFTCILYFTVPEWLLSYGTDKLEVISFGTGLMFFVALFQIPDGLQVTFQGILRGMSVTRPTMWITIGTCFLSVPLAYTLAFKTSWGAKGLWIALAISLTIQTGLYFNLLMKKLKNLKRHYNWQMV